MIKTRHILFDKANLYDVVTVFQQNGFLSSRMGNCGWKNAPNAMYAVFTSSNRKYVKILQNLKEKGIDTLPETIGY